MKKILCLVSTTSLLLYGSLYPSQGENSHSCPCHFSQQIIRRVAFDIGSGKTKMQISDVDVGEGKIKNILLTDSIKVALREDLTKSADGRLSSEIQEKLIQALLQLKRKVDPLCPVEYHAVATESLRLAKNAEALVERIKKETGVSVTIISQEQEGILGFISASQEVEENPDTIVAWDFGGGSFQITTKIQDRYVVYQGKFGKVPFKNTLLTLQGRDLLHHESPNPISRQQFQQALQWIQANMQDVPAEILYKLKQPDVVVLGIGIHPLSKMANNTIFDQQRVWQEIEKRLTLDDRAISIKDSLGACPDEYTPYVVSNLILTYGIMKALNIQKVHYVGKQGAIAVGVLLSPQYWNPSSIKDMEKQPLSACESH